MPSFIGDAHGRPARLVVLFGILFAVAQLAYNRSLWIDESALALNILSRDYASLMQPLDDLQIAPILYLWLLKTFTLVLGPSEPVLRAPSLIAFALSLLLFHRILRRYVSSEGVVFLTLLLFVFNNKLLYYAGEVKQYMTDVLATLTVLYVVTHPGLEFRRRMVWLTIIGGLGVFLSNALVPFLPMAFLYLLLSEPRPYGRRFIRGMAAMAAVWAVAFGTNYFTFLHGHPSKAAQLLNFEYAFPPPAILSKQFPAWFLHYVSLMKRDFGMGVNNIRIGLPTEDNLHFLLCLIPIAVFAYHAYRRGRILLLLLLPFGIHAIMAWMKLYPLAIRTALYQYPLVLIMAAVGFSRIRPRLARFGKALPYALAVYGLLLGGLFLRSNLFRKVEEGRSVLKGMVQRMAPGEGTYVYIHGRGITDYYHRTGVFNPTGPVQYAQRIHSGNPAAYADEAATLPGPFWLVFAHVKYGDDRAILTTLGRRGYLVTDSIRETGASAYRAQPPPR